MATDTLTTSTDQTDANLALVSRALRLLITEATPQQLAELYAPDFRYHGPRRELTGVQGARSISHDYAAGFSDAQFTVDSIEPIGDRVRTQISLRGRHTGRYEGHPPTGRVMEATGVFVHRVENGRIAEVWAVLHWN